MVGVLVLIKIAEGLGSVRVYIYIVVEPVNGREERKMKAV